jgi:hypothetical protein
MESEKLEQLPSEPHTGVIRLSVLRSTHRAKRRYAGGLASRPICSYVTEMQTALPLSHTVS